MTTAYERLVEALQRHGCTVVDRGDHGSASTPGHSADDRGTTFRKTPKGVVIYVHNGDREQVLADLGLTMSDLYDRPKVPYDYPDGRKVVRTYRGGRKSFTQSGNKTGRALYGSDQLPENRGALVLVVEGEKDVDTARAVGAFAVSQAQGASTPPDRADWSPLQGRPVLVVADKDEAGRKRAQLVADHLTGIAARVDIAEAKAGNDLSDHIAADYDIGDLVVRGARREPNTPQLDGAQILDDVRAAFRRYVVLPSAHAEVAVSLWVVTTHLTPCFEYAPRLVARSPEKRSGKSRLLEVADALVYEPLRAVNATVAYIFRSLDADPPPTLLFDEADTIFGSKKVAEQNEDLRGLLNAGFQRGLPFGRTVGPNHMPMTFETFAMAALAGIGRMPDTIEDRAVVVVMRRRKPSETVAPYRTRRDRPPLEQLRLRIAEWAAAVSPDLEGHEPDALGVEDRAADVWEPLVSVADMAGGDWPQMARRAAKAMVEEARADDEASSTNVQLLADIKDVFASMHVSFLKSAVLCDQLHQIEESPWKQFELTPSKLGHRLREYGIKTGHNTAKTERGYRIEDFHDAFERYLSASRPSEGVQTRPNHSDQHEQSDTLKTPDTFKASGNPKASNEIPSSDTKRTGPDTFGQHPAGNPAKPGDPCTVCGNSIGYAGLDTGLCRRCQEVTAPALEEGAA
ncbi:DUF3631 domain-containing protein [Nocardia donostiensis]|uniref:DUF3631 domain-containing protein n=1 Tax=Nocardia donostiensis TaxID=1538463 RepID=A0A1W0BCB8_9NOCA|nr:DUF3631 domain-containing protein [Nocardia donostiensis]ONM47170.1 hypothetical protein B0T46_19580 [Nocardia donostiensis]OQS20155.1 hypothetical protein B0T44_11570 [Nocardia donostiensis]